MWLAIYLVRLRRCDVTGIPLFVCFATKFKQEQQRSTGQTIETDASRRCRQSGAAAARQTAMNRRDSLRTISIHNGTHVP